MISRFYTTAFEVYRQVYTDNKSEEALQSTFNGHLQQASPNLIASLADTYKLEYLVWCSRAEDVRPGDTLKVDDTRYTVLAVQDNMVGTNDHYELHVRKA